MLVSQLDMVKERLYIVTDSKVSSLYPLPEDIPHFILDPPGEHLKSIETFNEVLTHMISLNLD